MVTLCALVATGAVTACGGTDESRRPAAAVRLSEIFYDPALAGHQSVTDLIATPADNAMQIVYADTGATTQSFGGAGVGFGVTVDMGDGLKGKVKVKIDGDPGWPT